MPGLTDQRRRARPCARRRASRRRPAGRARTRCRCWSTLLNALGRVPVEAEADDERAERRRHRLTSGSATACSTPAEYGQNVVPSAARPARREDFARSRRASGGTRPASREDASPLARARRSRSAPIVAWYSSAIGCTVGGSSVAAAPLSTGRSAMSSPLTTKSSNCVAAVLVDERGGLGQTGRAGRSRPARDRAVTR